MLNITPDYIIELNINPLAFFYVYLYMLKTEEQKIIEIKLGDISGRFDSYPVMDHLKFL